MSDVTKTAPTLAMLRERRDEILSLAERFGGSHVRVFGSVARGDAMPDSDIDLLVDFADWVSLYDLSGLTQELRELLGYSVDVVEDHARLKERFKRRISRDIIAL